ncbi:hypothetical protein [Novosphingobium sp.]|uniref:hypothetical protein n=1 Tax=Novosphingobium sp. TaxID=1874826 RepID=UPI002608E36A|nr:hypothetical protein [Novosphingobium sp.]
MAKVVTAFADNSGAIHAAPIDAILVDLTAVLGRIGAEGGLTTGLAQIILEKRSEIEMIFADFDAMTAATEARP